MSLGDEGLGSPDDQRCEVREGVPLLELGLGMHGDADLGTYGGIVGAGYSDMILVRIHEFHEVGRQLGGMPKMHLLESLQFGWVEGRSASSSLSCWVDGGLTLESEHLSTSALLLYVDDVSGLVDGSRRLLLLRLNVREFLVKALELRFRLRHFRSESFNLGAADMELS